MKAICPGTAKPEPAREYASRTPLGQGAATQKRCQASATR